ncbi:MAG: hypothetical protein ABII12_17685 [Planctomycetota bacterium]
MSLSAKPFQHLANAARFRAVWLGIPILLYLWTVTAPFVFDDLNLILKTEQYVNGESDRLDLFRFATTDQAWQEMRDRGTYPWWAPESKRIDFFRPLAEWSFYFDMLLFGRNPIGHRLVSMAWFVLALICMHRLFAVAGRDKTRAGVATLLFGISQTATQPVTFISNRSDLLVLVGATTAAWAYWKTTQTQADAFAVNGRGQRRNTQWLIVLVALGFTFALLSKEVAVAFAIVIVCHQWLVRKRRSSLGATRARATITAIVLLLTVAYLIYYTATRLMPFESANTVGDDLIPAAVRAPKALFLFLSVWTIGFPISLLFQATPAQVAAVVVIGALATLLTLWHLRRSMRGDPAAAFFGIWAIAFLLPALMAASETRAICLATVGWSYLLAGLLVPSEAGRPSAPLWVRHWLFVANGAVSIACAVGAVLFTNAAEQRARRAVNTYVRELDTPLRDGDTLIVAEARSPIEFVCAGDRLEFMTGRRNVAFSCLTVPGTNADFERRDPHSLLMTVTKGSLLDSPMHHLTLGADWRPTLGHTFRLSRFTAEIVDVTDDDRVTALAFRFEEPLASPRLHFWPSTLAAIARDNAPANGTSRAVRSSPPDPTTGQ